MDGVLFGLPIKYSIASNNKLRKTGLETQLSPKVKLIYTIIENRPNIQSGEISTKLSIPLPTVKRILSAFNKKGLIEKQGSGRSVSYSIR